MPIAAAEHLTATCQPTHVSSVPTTVTAMSERVKYVLIINVQFRCLLIHVQMALKTEEDAVMQELSEEVLQRRHQVLQ